MENLKILNLNKNSLRGEKLEIFAKNIQYIGKNGTIKLRGTNYFPKLHSLFLDNNSIRSKEFQILSQNLKFLKI